MAVQSKLTKVVANQVGKLQGEIEARVQTELESKVQALLTECPPVPELKQIVSAVNNIQTITSQFKSRIDKTAAITRPLSAVVSAASVLLRLIKANPIPIAIGTPPGPAGGLVFSQTSGQVASTADKLQKITQQLDSLNQDISSVSQLTSSFEQTLSKVNPIIATIQQLVANCAANSTDEELQDLLIDIQPRENTGSEGTPNESFTYRSTNGKDYTLAIIDDRSTDNAVPRRLAVAKDLIGVIILRGQPSFSSNTQVLLDELKFRIDNQLP